MDGSVAGQQTGWPQGVAEPVFDLVAAKLLRPLVRPGTVGRPALIERLARDARPIVSVVAPAGYGKTTLLSQLAEHNGQACMPPSVPGASALTAAELRLLPMLATHLSVPEIAAELFLSPHTIKSQMKSIYRKLDSSTRTQTVTRARGLGLLEG